MGNSVVRQWAAQSASLRIRAHNYIYAYKLTTMSRFSAKKAALLPAALLFIFAFLFTGCNDASPEKYFDIAVLNSNMMAGFAGRGMEMQLEQPSAKLVEGSTDKTEPMKRKEVVDDKITYLENNLKRLKALSVTDDARQIITTSTSLHEYILPVYKNEYTALAAAYDNGAATEETSRMSQAINEKYYTGFEQRMNELTAAGKAFAAKHNIRVNWGDH